MVPRRKQHQGRQTSLGRAKGCDSDVACPGVSYPKGIGSCRHLVSCLCGSLLFVTIGLSVLNCLEWSFSGHGAAGKEQLWPGHSRSMCLSALQGLLTSCGGQLQRVNRY